MKRKSARKMSVLLLIVLLLLTPAAALAEDGAGPPEIVTPPAHVSIAPGEPAGFTVLASGQALQYQWQVTDPDYGRFGWAGGLAWLDLADADGVSGADTASLLLSEAVAQEYYTAAFRCVVTNGAGEVISEPAILAVSGAWPVLTAVRGTAVGPHAIGLGLDAGYPITAEVTVPHEADTLALSDLTLDFGPDDSSPILYLYPDESYYLDNEPDGSYNFLTQMPEGEPSTDLDVGTNEIYFTINLTESRIHYRLVVTREAGEPEPPPPPPWPAFPPAPPEESPPQPEESPAQPEESPAQPEESPTPPEESPAQPEESPTPPEESPAQPEESLTPPEVPLTESFPPSATPSAQPPLTGDTGGGASIYLFALLGLSLLGMGVTLHLRIRGREKIDKPET